jgi:hypothetical protein
MSPVGRVLSLAFTLVISPLSGAKLPFRKHHFSGYESQLPVKNSHSDDSDCSNLATTRKAPVILELVEY